MSTIEDDRPSSLETGIAARIRAERDLRDWSLAELAGRSGVSRAMISRIERGEVSPTAVLLNRLAGAFALTLSGLLARVEADLTQAGQVLRAADQPLWRDPESGYLRRSITPPGATPELVEVTLPPDGVVAFPAAPGAPVVGQCLWILAGTLRLQDGERAHELRAGDCLVVQPGAPRRFRNPSSTESCRYLVALARPG